MEDFADSRGCVRRLGFELVSWEVKWLRADVAEARFPTTR